MLPLPYVDPHEIRPLLRAAARGFDRWTLDALNAPLPHRGRR